MTCASRLSGFVVVIFLAGCGGGGEGSQPPSSNPSPGEYSMIREPIPKMVRIEILATPTPEELLGLDPLAGQPSSSGDVVSNVTQ